MTRDAAQSMTAGNVVSFIEYIIRSGRKDVCRFGSAGQVVSFGGNNVISLAERR